MTKIIRILNKVTGKKTTNIDIYNSSKKTI